MRNIKVKNGIGVVSRRIGGRGGAEGTFGFSGGKKLKFLLFQK